jgi:hypothetical protein
MKKGTDLHKNFLKAGLPLEDMAHMPGDAAPQQDLAVGQAHIGVQQQGPFTFLCEDRCQGHGNGGLAHAPLAAGYPDHPRLGRTCLRAK